jgi:hypothetical protein
MWRGEETHLLVGLVFFVGAAAFLLQSATNSIDEHRDTLQHIVLQHCNRVGPVRRTRCDGASQSE